MGRPRARARRTPTRVGRLGGASFLFVSFLAGSARADGTEEDRARCAASYESAQVLRREEHLEAARAQLLICQSTCPAALVRDCAKWLLDVAALRPTVRFVARDPGGQSVSDVTVLMDGRLLVDRLDDAVAIEPGPHVFRFERRGSSPAEARAEIHAGERDRAIAVVLAVLPPSAAVAPPQSRSPTASYLAFGVGATALLTAGALAIKGDVDRAALRSSCAPSCDGGRVDAVRTLWWTAAGVAAGGAVAVAVGIVLWPRGDRNPSVAGATLLLAPRSVALGWTLP